MHIAALGRKNYYGSGSVAGGHFTACLFSIFQTLKLWNVNPDLGKITCIYSIQQGHEEKLAQRVSF